MPQVGDDVELDQVPDRFGYAFTPGWVVETAPAHEVEVHPEEVVVVNGPDGPVEHVVPAVTMMVPATYEAVPPRARLLRADLQPEDVTPSGVVALVADLEGKVAETRVAWGCPDTARVLVAYRFEV